MTKSLDHLYPGIQVDKQKVHIHPNHLFNRLLAITQRENNMAPYFEYELTALLTSLFKENFMRKPLKSQLAKALEIGVQSYKETPQLQFEFLMEGPFFIE